MDNKITVWAYLKEYEETKDEILKAVTDVFESGTLILGQKGKDFEEHILITLAQSMVSVATMAQTLSGSR